MTTTRLPLSRMLTAIAVTALIGHSLQAASVGDIFQFRLPDGSSGDSSLVYGKASLETASGLGPNGEAGLMLEMDTTNLVPGAYTMWGAVFNHPEA